MYVVEGSLLMSVISRGNIGNARLAGLEDHLNMTGDQYNIALTIFFVPYIVFEVPANMALKYLSPRVWSKHLFQHE
jgi:hypothetical protein